MAPLGLRGVGLGMSQDSPLDAEVYSFPLEFPGISSQLGRCLLGFQLE